MAAREGSSLSLTSPQRASLPGHSPNLCFSSGPSKGALSIQPTPGPPAFPDKGMERADFFRKLQVCQGDPVMAPPIALQRKFPILHDPALTYLSSLVSHLFLPCPYILVARIYSSQNTSHVCDFANALPLSGVPFPLSFSGEFLPIHHNSV